MDLDARIKEIMNTEEFKTLIKHVEPTPENYQKILGGMLRKDYPKLGPEAMQALDMFKSEREILRDRLRHKINQTKQRRATQQTNETLSSHRQELLEKFAKESKQNKTVQKKKTRNRSRKLKKRYGDITEDQYLEALTYLREHPVNPSGSDVENPTDASRRGSDIDLVRRYQNMVRLYQDQHSLEEELILSDDETKK